ncbi:MAG: MATE family efflux transporter [Bacteroidales bacterium]|nr:MATE family efflux transporter [Bacteroidales bacterium]
MSRIVNSYFSGYSKPGGMKELILLAFPMMISTACDGVMTFTDRLFLSRLSSEQMNAAMGGAVALQMLMFFFVGLTGYSTALVAQYFGAGENQNATRASFQAILITIAAWPVVVLLEPIAVSFFNYAQIPANQMIYQAQYLNILAWGSLFGMMRYTLGCYFTGIGKTKIVMKATLIAMLVNVVLDYLFIFGKMGFPSMEIRGAALATIIGSFSAVLVLVTSYFSKTNRVKFLVMKSFHYSASVMKKLFHFGYPAGLEMFLNFLAFSIIIALFHSQGESIATASTIMFNWDMVSFIPLMGIEIAVTSLVGRYMGAGLIHQAQHAAISGIKTGVFYSLAILILFLWIPETLVRVFRPDIPDGLFENSVPIAVSMIRIASIYVLAEAIMAGLVGALRGAGDTHFTMKVSIFTHWFLVLILYVSLKMIHVPVTVAWLFLSLCFLMFCGVLILRFRSGKWKTIKVIHPQS